MDDELITLFEKPAAEEIYMIAGWRQWADAGSISSALPEYLIELMDAKKIGEMNSDGYYLFQIPGTHHFLRPIIKLNDGYREDLEVKRNEFFYADFGRKGVIIFVGDEPHLNVERYAQAFFQIVKSLNVKRVAAVGGVYGEMPYDKDRRISSIYSLKNMKAELDKYAVNYSNYEGGATIGSYLVDRAELEQVPFLTFYAFVPAYDFSISNTAEPQGIRIEQDFKAWYDIMRRLKHMFDLDLDLSELETQSIDLMTAIEAKIEEIGQEIPQLKVDEYLEHLDKDFTEMPFMPLDDVWAEGLADIFSDGEGE